MLTKEFPVNEETLTHINRELPCETHTNTCHFLFPLVNVLTRNFLVKSFRKQPLTGKPVLACERETRYIKRVVSTCGCVSVCFFAPLCVSVCLCVSLCVCMSLCVCLWISMLVCVAVCFTVCLGMLCVYVCVCLCVCPCLCASLCMSLRLCVSLCNRTSHWWNLRHYDGLTLTRFSQFRYQTVGEIIWPTISIPNLLIINIPSVSSRFSI